MSDQTTVFCHDGICSEHSRHLALDVLADLAVDLSRLLADFTVQSGSTRFDLSDDAARWDALAGSPLHAARLALDDDRRYRYYAKMRLNAHVLCA